MGNSHKTLKILLGIGGILLVAGATTLVAGAGLAGAGMLTAAIAALGLAWKIGHYPR